MDFGTVDPAAFFIAIVALLVSVNSSVGQLAQSIDRHQQRKVQVQLAGPWDIYAPDKHATVKDMFGHMLRNANHISQLVRDNRMHLAPDGFVFCNTAADTVCWAYRTLGQSTVVDVFLSLLVGHKVLADGWIGIITNLLTMWPRFVYVVFLSVRPTAPRLCSVIMNSDEILWAKCVAQDPPSSLGEGMGLLCALCGLMFRQQVRWAHTASRTSGLNAHATWASMAADIVVWWHLLHRCKHCASVPRCTRVMVLNAFPKPLFMSKKYIETSNWRLATNDQCWPIGIAVGGLSTGEVAVAAALWVNQRQNGLALSLWMAHISRLQNVRFDADKSQHLLPLMRGLQVFSMHCKTLLCIGQRMEGELAIMVAILPTLLRARVSRLFGKSGVEAYDNVAALLNVEESYVCAPRPPWCGHADWTHCECLRVHTLYLPFAAVMVSAQDMLPVPAVIVTQNEELVALHVATITSCTRQLQRPIREVVRTGELGYIIDGQVDELAALKIGRESLSTDVVSTGRIDSPKKLQWHVE
ncbi:hypothetical protein BGW37DRAFT_524287 [Umbelopsis sp. PMI_123]|nr:hypothetical protein BGW37DRAFT_524287 [Umbelopsis sp. PMI_123]